jgi:hypothetical protein
VIKLEQYCLVIQKCGVVRAGGVVLPAGKSIIVSQPGSTKQPGRTPVLFFGISFFFAEFLNEGDALYLLSII